MSWAKSAACWSKTQDRKISPASSYIYLASQVIDLTQNVPAIWSLGVQEPIPLKKHCSKSRHLGKDIYKVTVDLTKNKVHSLLGFLFIVVLGTFAGLSIVCKTLFVVCKTLLAANIVSYRQDRRRKGHEKDRKEKGMRTMAEMDGVNLCVY